MAEIHLTLTAEECQALTGLLETSVKNMLVEEHRTRSPIYREGVIHQEHLLKTLLIKAREASGVSREACCAAGAEWT